MSERARERERRCVCVIRCEVLGAALCSLKGPGCCPALCSSSTILHVLFLSSHHLSSTSFPIHTLFSRLLRHALFSPSVFFLPLPPLDLILQNPSATTTKPCFPMALLINEKWGTRVTEGSFHHGRVFDQMDTSCL